VRDRDLPDAGEGLGRFDHRQELGVASRHAAPGLHRIGQFRQQPDVAGAVDLGQQQTLDCRRDHRFQVAHRQLQRPIDANQNVGAVLPADPGCFRHHPARGLLFGRCDAVLQIEDQGVGAAAAGLLDIFPDIDRYEQQ
jgi:hypothetical protein